MIEITRQESNDLLDFFSLTGGKIKSITEYKLLNRQEHMVCKLVKFLDTERVSDEYVQIVIYICALSWSKDYTGDRIKNLGDKDIIELLRESMFFKDSSEREVLIRSLMDYYIGRGRVIGEQNNKMDCFR